jgi:2-polyprenyl-3-methyl-5-hydroxy-6-metoxy-1,4-benzoquinol methylase
MKPIRVIFGISSVGKSTFVQQQKCTNLISESAKVMLAHQITAASLSNRDFETIIHYNALNPFDNSADKFCNDIACDPVADALFTKYYVDYVDVLIANPSTIKKRILLRKYIDFQLQCNVEDYPYLEIFEFVSRYSIIEIYERWFSFFKTRNIPMKFFSTEPGAGPIETIEEARSILSSVESTEFNDSDKALVLERFPNSYQSEYGKVRETTFNLIHPYLLGHTILDVGCAEGYFCFQSEKVGIQNVVGTELKIDRFLSACAIKEITGSRCSFSMENIFEKHIEDNYDTILMLNVLHHLPDPIHALTTLSQMCQRHLILEYPTLEDPKFRKTLPNCDFDLSKMPFIGVSCLGEQDQTYLFSDYALKRICVENAKLFRSIKFLQSPMSKSRRIAVCFK